MRLAPGVPGLWRDREPQGSYELGWEPTSRDLFLILFWWGPLSYSLWANFSYISYNTVSTTEITRFSIRSSDLIHLIMKSSHPLTNLCLFPHPQPLVATTTLLSISMSLTFVFRFYMELTPSMSIYLSFSVRLISLSMMPSGFIIHVVANDKSSFFFKAE